MRRYTHAVLGHEIHAAAGHYVIVAEERLSVGGREVLVATGYAVVDSACCGVAGCGFALVPGYLLGWKVAHDADGAAQSEVEAIRDEGERAAVRAVIEARRTVQQVNFW